MQTAKGAYLEIVFSSEHGCNARPAAGGRTARAASRRRARCRLPRADSVRVARLLTESESAASESLSWYKTYTCTVVLGRALYIHILVAAHGRRSSRRAQDPQMVEPSHLLSLFFLRPAFFFLLSSFCVLRSSFLLARQYDSMDFTSAPPAS